MAEAPMYLPANWQHLLLDESMDIDAVFEQVVVLVHAGYLVRPPVFRRLIGYILTSPTDDVTQNRLLLWAEAVRSARTGCHAPKPRERKTGRRQLLLDEAFHRTLEAQGRVQRTDTGEQKIAFALALLGWPAQPRTGDDMRSDDEDEKKYREWRDTGGSSGVRFFLSILRTFLRLSMGLEHPRDLPSALGFYLADVPVEATELSWRHPPDRPESEFMPSAKIWAQPRSDSPLRQLCEHNVGLACEEQSQDGSLIGELHGAQGTQRKTESLTGLSCRTDALEWIEICGSGASWKELIEREDIELEHIRRNVIRFLGTLVKLLSGDCTHSPTIREAASGDNVRHQSSTLCERTDGTSLLRVVFADSVRLECGRKLRSGLFQTLPSMLIDALHRYLAAFAPGMSGRKPASTRLRKGHRENLTRPVSSAIEKQNADVFPDSSTAISSDEEFRAAATLSIAFDLCAAFTDALGNSSLRASELKHCRSSFYGDLAAHLVQPRQTEDWSTADVFGEDEIVKNDEEYRGSDVADSETILIPRSALALFIAMPGNVSLKLFTCDCILDSQFGGESTDAVDDHWRFKEPCLMKLVRYSLHLYPFSLHDGQSTSSFVTSWEKKTNLTAHLGGGLGDGTTKISADRPIGSEYRDIRRFEEYSLAMIGLLDGYICSLQTNVLGIPDHPNLSASWQKASSSLIRILETVSQNSLCAPWCKHLVAQLEKLGRFF
jgi:hypothetical protein